jgi:hypothetical protein
MAANSTLRQYRTIAYIVAVFVGFWLILKLWHATGGSAKPSDARPPTRDYR